MAAAVKKNDPKTKKKGKPIARSLSKMVTKSPKYMLVVLHTRPDGRKDDEDDKKTTIDYISLAMDLFIFGFLAAIGTAYHDGVGDKSDPWNRCNYPIPLFLMITGYSNVVLSLFRFALPVMGTLAQCLFNMVSAGVGGYLVFGNYPTWNGLDPNADTYCNTLPFLAAFIFTVVTILWYAIIVLIVALVVCVAITGADKDVHGMRASEQIFVMSKSQYNQLLNNVRKETVKLKSIGSRSNNNNNNTKQVNNVANSLKENLVKETSAILPHDVIDVV